MTTTASAPPRGCEAAAAIPDSTLMVRIADGDTDAFEELYRRHVQRVLMQARKICASRELAEDVTQEAFLSLWRSAHAYRPARGNVSAWLSSMVRNRAIDAWRRASIRPVEVETIDDGAGQLVDPTNTDMGAAEREREFVLSLLAGLPTEQKEAVFLAYFADLTQAEIATLAHAPLGTVKGRVRLGLMKLRHGFEQHPHEPRAQQGPPRPALSIA